MQFLDCEFVHPIATLLLPIKVYLLSNDEHALAAQQQLQEQQLQDTNPSTPPPPHPSLDSQQQLVEQQEPKTPPPRNQQRGKELVSNEEEGVQKLSPPAADPDFIYGMEANEGISDLYESYEEIGGQNAAEQRHLFE